MPGMVGLIGNMPKAQAERELVRMVEAIRHEAYYNTGTWIDVSQGIYVGWTVPKGCFADAMPIRNENGDKILIFSGEDFSDRRTHHLLKDRGHDFDGQDASYIVHLYEEDPLFVRRLNGRFHGLLTDRTRGTTTL